MITLTRRYGFSASHRLHAPGLSDTENQELFGKCNNPFGHGHNYFLEVTVAGEVDDTTGLLCPVAKLDQLVEESILQHLRYCNLNTDVAEFDTLVPTTENLARVVAELLKRNWKEHWEDFRVQLHRIFIQETERNTFEVMVAEGVTPSVDA